MFEDENVNPQEDQQEVEPVKLSTGATVGLVIGLLVMVFILVMTIRGCSISKTVNSGSVDQTYETQITEPEETASNVPRETSKVEQNEPEIEGTVSAPPENSTSGNNSDSTDEDSNAGKSDGFTEVADPVLSGVTTNYGMVIGKHIYTREGSYIYGVSISIVINEKSVMAEYFCPRKTYQELKSGDSLEVSYQVDSNGNISIYSISRG